MEGCEKWKRRGTYRRRSLRQALFARFMLKHDFRGKTSKPWRLRCLHSLSAGAVSDDREVKKAARRHSLQELNRKMRGKVIHKCPPLLPVSSRPYAAWSRA